MSPDDIWNMAAFPRNGIRPGLYNVKGLSGPLRGFNMLGDKKRILSSDADLCQMGYNLIKDYDWGYFYIQKLGKEGMDDPFIENAWRKNWAMRADIVLNYNHPFNSSVVNTIRDFIRPYPGGHEDMWIGRLVWRKTDAGFFTLERLGD